MTDSSRPAVATPWRKTRFGFVAFVALSMLLGWTLLRVVLFGAFATGDTSFAELAKLFADRARLEGEIAELKAGKEKKQKTEAEYDAELEKLLLELATVSQKIRSKQK